MATIQERRIAYRKIGFLRFLTIFFVISLKTHSLNGVGNPLLENQNDLMQQEIKHVVVLMLENRSFDNLLGWLYSEDAPLHFIPSNRARPFQGLSKGLLNRYTNPLRNSSGEIVFSCPPIQGVPSTIGSKLINSPACDPNEPFDHVTNQIFGFGGSMQASMLGFLQDYATLWDESDWVGNKQAICAVMESYTAQQLPVLHGLARHYAVSDLWFSSVPTQTNPNRAFLVCGTSDGQIINGELGQNTFSADTIWNRLEDQVPDTSWTIFWQTDRFPVIYPGPYNSPQMFPALTGIPNLDQHYQQLDVFHALARQGELPDFSFIEPQWTLLEAIHLDQLREDHPDSQFLLGIQGNDLHPPGDVRTAENLLANIYTSLISNPEAWEKTLFVVLFDEHGGIFDHISPPSSLAPDDHFEYGFTFDRYGVRTPALFISPRIKQGTVIRSASSVPFDHTSLIATILKWKNIDPTQWYMGERVAAAPTFEGIVTESVPRNDPIISEANFATEEEQTLNMGDPIVLKDRKGNYLAVSNWDDYATTTKKEESANLQFCPSAGKITHGSFVLIKLNDPSLSDEYLLDSCSLIGDCYYSKNSHTPSQWWTIKSVDYPYLGYEIKNGDRVYLECHVYLDPLTFVPARLATGDSLFLNESVTTKAITEEGVDEVYWIIEKKENEEG
jgi:phospholipase C